MWRVVLFDLVGPDPGRIRKRVRPSSAPWTSRITGDGTCAFTFELGDAEDESTLTIAEQRAQRAQDYLPNARGLAVIWSGLSGAGDPIDVVMYAGKIEAYEYAFGSQEFVVETSEIRGEFRWRFPYRMNAPASGDLAVSDKSRHGAVRAVLQRMFSLGARFGLPIDLPADSAGSVSARWEWWRKFRSSDLLEQIEDTGGEVLFKPYLTADRQHIRWETIVATRLELSRSTFLINADESPLEGIRYRVDGTQQVTELQGQGTGTGEDAPIEYALASTDRGIIARQGEVSFPGLKGARLKTAAERAMAARELPLVEVSVATFRIGGGWSAVHPTPGRAWHLKVQGDPVIPDSQDIAVRVVQASGGIEGDAIAVEVQ